MADNKQVMNNNQQPAAAAAASLPASKDEVPPPLPDMDNDVKQQIKPHRPLLAAVLVDVKKPASSPLPSSISPPPVAVIMPGADNNNNTTTTTTTTPPAAVRRMLLIVVCLLAFLNAFAFAAAGIAMLIANRTPCTKVRNNTYALVV